MRDRTADEHNPAAGLTMRSVMSATMSEPTWAPLHLNEDLSAPNPSPTRCPRDVGYLRLAEIAPAAGVGQNAIAYGVIVSITQNVDGDSLQDATQSLIQNLQQTNSGLRIYDSPRKVQIAGVEGFSTMLAGNSPVKNGDQPLAERDWLITLPRTQGGMLHLVFIAPENQFAQLQPTYQKMLDSLQLK